MPPGSSATDSATFSRAGTARARDEERSDEDAPAAAGPAVSASQSKTQRIAKACDRCRKSKSRCEPSPVEGAPCKTCAATGAECAYTAPSFRRGPPKGYIQALEHRLHQVESVLAAIMSSQDPRSLVIVEELHSDELASYILDSVDSGPFGKTGREQKAFDTTKDNFYTSIVTEQPKAVSHRSRRQSRANRENVIDAVIANDPQIHTTRPTLAWQDRLTARLDRAILRALDESTTSQTQAQSIPTASPGSIVESAVVEPPTRKRRVGAGPPSRVMRSPSSGGSSPQPLAAVVEEDLDDCADAFGNLSIDENREVRYHGNSAGLQLLAQAERSDGRNARGVWQFPMAKFWPGPSPNMRVKTGEQEMSIAIATEQSIPVPPVEVQDHLVQVYFTFVNQAIPVLDEESFMEQYNAYKFGYPDSDEVHPQGDARPERPQKLSKLLLLAVFAYAASHLDPFQNYTGDVEDPATEYAKYARMILDTIYHESRSSTVQALILLGVREFGIGSLEEGWLHIGMASRMALDLGLNRDPDKWRQGGRELFTEQEKSIRKRIWYACCLSDKLSALWLGRTIGIHEGDFSTPLPDIPQHDAQKMWQPCAPHPLASESFSLVPAYPVEYLCHLSKLFIITGEVLSKIYRVSRANVQPKRHTREVLHARMTQWDLELPEYLNYKPPSNRPCPAPHVLAMLIQYWSSLILLHRPFIPKGSELARFGSPSLDPDPLPWESYAICQGAAAQVVALGEMYHGRYDMRWSPPHLSNCFQTAGIVHIITLRYKPLDTQASVGLHKCIKYLGAMERTWAMSLRIRHLIQNAHVDVDRRFNAPPAPADHQNPPERQRRRSRATFEEDNAPIYGEFNKYDTLPGTQALAYQVPSVPNPSALSGAPTLPGVTPVDPISRYRHPAQAVFAPGYDSWWSELDQQPVPAQAPVICSGPTAPSTVTHSGDVGPTGLTHGLPTGDFTFGSQHFSPDFIQAMRDPVIHFPSAFY